LFYLFTFLHPFKSKVELNQKSSSLIYPEINFFLKIANFLYNGTDKTYETISAAGYKIKIL